MPQVALVTGANRGIGLSISRLLLRAGYRVLLGCRTSAAGQAAIAALRQDCANASLEPICVDIADPASIQRAVAAVGERAPGGLDALINNAGFAYTVDAKEPFGMQARVTVGINYTGTVAMCNAFLPLVKAGGRIVNVSSRAGLPHIVRNDAVRRAFLACATQAELDGLMARFVASAEAGTIGADGFPTTAYGTSKLGETLFSMLFARSPAVLERGIAVFACCPGYCQTDMTLGQGDKSAEEGADTPAWLAVSDDAKRTIPPGSFVGERTVIPWPA